MNSLQSHRVLLLDGEARAALAYVRSLGACGVEVLVGSSIPGPLAGYSRYCAGTVRYPDAIEHPDAFVSWLETFAREQRLDAVLAMDDAGASTLATHVDGRSTLDLSNAAVLSPSQTIFQRAFDKGETLAWAQKLEVPAPFSRVVHSPEQALEAFGQVGLPLIIKPRSSSGSRGLHFIEHEEALLSVWNGVFREFGAPLVQERVPGPARKIQVAVVLNRAARTRGVCVQELVRQYPLAGGPGTYVVSIENDEASTLGVRLLEGIGWVGAAVVEFLVDPSDGRLKLMEINPRPWGTTSACVHAGLDVPRMVLEIALNGDCDQAAPCVPGRQWRWLFPGDMLCYAATKDRSGYEPPPWRFRGVADLVLSADDPDPIVGMLANLLRRSLDRSAWRHVFARGLTA